MDSYKTKRRVPWCHYPLECTPVFSQVPAGHSKRKKNRPSLFPLGYWPIIFTIVILVLPQMIDFFPSGYCSLNNVVIITFFVLLLPGAKDLGCQRFLPRCQRVSAGIPARIKTSKQNWMKSGFTGSPTNPIFHVSKNGLLFRLNFSL